MNGFRRHPDQMNRPTTMRLASRAVRLAGLFPGFLPSYLRRSLRRRRKPGSADVDEAIEVASKNPGASFGVLELRPVEE